MSNKRPRFNKTGVLVGSTNMNTLSRSKRFHIVARYSTTLFSIAHLTLSYNIR
jgi:hypothetical protein